MNLSVSRSIVAAMLWFLSFSVYAKYNVTSPKLLDAKQLLTSQPQQSLLLVQSYLKERTLLSETGLNSFTFSENKRTRTPLNTVFALHLKTDAHIKLKQWDQAISSLQSAYDIAKKNQLRFLKIDTKIKMAKIYWQDLKQDEQALSLLNEQQTFINQLLPAFPVTLQSQLNHNIELQKAQIYTIQNNPLSAETHFKLAEKWLVNLLNPTFKIEYLLIIGQYYYQQNHNELALESLHNAHLLATQTQNNNKKAEADLALAKLLHQEQVFDKAIEHAKAAAEYYEKSQQSPKFSRALGLIAVIYETQNRPNLALIHYFNALDIEKQFKKNTPLSEELRFNIARVYIDLNNIKKGEHYLALAKKLATKQNNNIILTKIKLLKGKIAIQKNDLDKAISLLQNTLIAASKFDLLDEKIAAEKNLSIAFEQNQDHYSALISQRRYEHLLKEKQQIKTEKHANLFREQQRIHRRTAHLQHLELQQISQNQERYIQYWLNGALLLFCLACLFFLYRRIEQNNRLVKRISQLKQQLYTHPNTGLQNLRLLNRRLPTSLKQTSEHFEQNTLQNLILNPSSDRLRFALVEIPQIKTWYREYGYQKAIKLEQNFGEYIRKKIFKPARIYHLSATVFLYIEPNARVDNNPQELAMFLDNMINQFMIEQSIDSNYVTRMGLAEYPFLPKSYTAINAPELMDILFIALSKAYQLNSEEMKTKENQWVHLKALEGISAAFFTQGNLQACCQQAIEQGLIKIKSSHPIAHKKNKAAQTTAVSQKEDRTEAMASR